MKRTSRILSILLALLMVFSVSVTALAAGGGGGNSGSETGTALTLVSAKIGDTLLAEATTIRSNDEILLTFSANVTDESVLANNISKISVRDSADQKMSSVSVSVSGTKKLTVSLNGIEKASYTLKIGQKVKDVDGNTLAEEISIPFTVNKGDGTGSGGGSNPLTFGGAKVGDADLSGAALKGNEVITLQFDRGMKGNETANAALIGVYKADGAKADYTVLPVDDSDDTAKQQVKVQLNGLAAGEYTLKIDKNVKANNGQTLGEDVTVSFTVKAADSGSDDANTIKNVINTVLNLLKKIIEFFKSLLVSK